MCINSNVNILNNNLGLYMFSSVIQSFKVTETNKYIRSQKGIHISKGVYIIGYKAYTHADNDTYINTKIDTEKEDFILFEKELEMPISTLLQNFDGYGLPYPRSVTNIMMYHFTNETDLYFYIKASKTIAFIPYEIWLVKIK